MTYEDIMEKEARSVEADLKRFAEQDRYLKNQNSGNGMED